MLGVTVWGLKLIAASLFPQASSWSLEGGLHIGLREAQVTQPSPASPVHANERQEGIVK